MSEAERWLWPRCGSYRQQATNARYVNKGIQDTLNYVYPDPG
jgi:hypothetical protein